MKQTPKIIRQARIKKGLTQKQISDKLNLTTSQFISNIELGKSPIPPDMVPVISRMLGVSISKLVWAFSKDMEFEFKNKVMKYKRKTS